MLFRPIFKGTFRENQMLAKAHIVILIENQIMPAFGNRFAFVDHTSQTRDMEETFGKISVVIPYYFHASLLATKVAHFRCCPSVGCQ